MTVQFKVYREIKNNVQVLAAKLQYFYFFTVFYFITSYSIFKHLSIHVSLANMISFFIGTKISCNNEDISTHIDSLSP